MSQFVPGTSAYEARHGVDQADATARNVKAAIPGTQEHRLQQTAGPHLGGTGHTGPMMGGTGMGGTGMTGTGAGYGTTGQHTSAGAQVKAHIPGTAEYAATHGNTNAHQAAQDIKAAIPGTREHRAKQGGGAYPSGGTY
jgi:hypothetical protein